MQDTARKSKRHVALTVEQDPSNIVPDNPITRSHVEQPTPRDNSVGNMDSSLQLEMTQPTEEFKSGSLFVRRTEFKSPNIPQSRVKNSKSSIKLTNLASVIQTPMFKSMPPLIQGSFHELFDYAQKLELVIKEKDEEISRLMFQNSYQFKIQERKEQIFTKVAEQNRNLIEETKKQAVELSGRATVEVQTKKKNDVIIKTTRNQKSSMSFINEASGLSQTFVKFKRQATQKSLQPLLLDSNSLQASPNIKKPVTEFRRGSFRSKKPQEVHSNQSVDSRLLEIGTKKTRSFVR